MNQSKISVTQILTQSVHPGTIYFSMNDRFYAQKFFRILVSEVQIMVLKTCCFNGRSMKDQGHHMRDEGRQARGEEVESRFAIKDEGFVFHLTPVTEVAKLYSHKD